ncbi:MAG: hypothetical protein ACERKN_07070 [Velocimicrobium sp.]
MKGICIATVSKVNYDKGTVDVTFPDRDDCTSSDLSIMDSEYNLPFVGDKVLVVFLTSDNSTGFVIGRPYNKKNMPTHYGKETIFKELVKEGYIKVSDGAMEIHIEKIVVEGDMEITGNLLVSGDLTVSGEIIN